MARRRRRTASTKSTGWLRWGIMRFFGVSSPFALAVYLASYLGFRPAGNLPVDPDTPEGRAKQIVEAGKALRDVLKSGGPAPSVANNDRGVGREPGAPLVSKTIVNVVQVDEYDRFFGFEAPPAVAARPLSPRPIEPAPPPAPPKKRTDFKGDFNPYR